MLDRGDFAKLVRDYNVNALQLTEDGIPQRELLTELGLDYVLPTLDKLDL